MKHRVFFIWVVFPMLLFCQQKPKNGNVIKDFGKTYEVEHPDFKTDTHSELKVVFDIGRSFGDSTKINALINTAARYLNMHATAGVSLDQMKVALVIHGNASNDILNDQKYLSKFGIHNPNTPLLSALHQKGVQIILCGQTAAHKNISKSDVHTNVQFSLSAMTALVQLQNKNYKLIIF